MIDRRDIKGSEGRLWALIAERTRAGADKERIDRRIWDLFGETWAVMFTDLSGFSRRVAEFGIIHFLQVIHEQEGLFLPLVADHDGLLIKIDADSMLILFKRADRALACAVAMQHVSDAYNRDRLPEEQVLLCVGIGHGHVLRIGDSDVWGKEVNAASKLGEDTAKAHEVLLTDDARTAAGDVAGVTFEELGIAVPGSDRNWRVRYPPA